MEVAGLALAVLAEVRTTASSIIKRIARFTIAPARFIDVCASVTRLILVVEAVQEIAERGASSFPIEVAPLFHASLCSVRDILFNLTWKLEENENKAVSRSYAVSGRTPVWTILTLLSGMRRRLRSRSSIC